MGSTSPGFTAFHRGGTGPPLVCLHGFLDTWRTWELVLPYLEQRHDVFAPTLPGHAGGPPLPDPAGVDGILDALERELDASGIEVPHLVGNSLGGYLALRLAARGRAASVVALAPAGGWASGDRAMAALLGRQRDVHEQARAAAPNADAIASSLEGRRLATRLIVSRCEHLPAELVAHQIRGVAACSAAGRLIDGALTAAWSLDAEGITCPVRVIWGTDDLLLRWPSAAKRFTDDWLPHADWVVLDGVGHCPQLDVPLSTAQLILGLAAV